MMAALFMIFFVAVLLAWLGFRTASVVVALFNLALCLAMFLYHITSTLNIRL